MKYHCLFLFLSLLCCQYVSARQYTTSDKLISNTVYRSYSDSKGYMWFGTDKGAVRYDGRSFRNYTLLDGLGDKDIFNFYEDKQKRLWLFSFNGANCFIRNDSVFNAGNDPLLKKMPVIPYPVVIVEADDGCLCFGYKSGMIIRLRGNDMDTINVAFHRMDALVHLYYSGDTLKAISKKAITSIIGTHIVKDDTFNAGACYLNKNVIYAPDIKGLKVYHHMKIVRQYNNERLNWDNMISMYVNDEDDIFCCTYDGLWIINHRTQQPEVILKNLKTTSVVRDISGNYWVTTIGNGIYCLNAAFLEMRSLGNERYDNTFYCGNRQVFFTKNDRLFVYDAAVPGVTALPLRFIGGIEPLYYTPRMLLYRYYSFHSWLMNTTNGARKELDLHTGFLKNVYECDSQRLIMTVFNQGRYLLWNTIRKAGHIQVCDSVFFRERITTAKYNPECKCFYVLTRQALYEYHVDDYRLKRLDTFSDKEPLDLFLINNHVIVPVNDMSVMVYVSGNAAFKKRMMMDMVIYACYRLKNRRYLVKSNKGFLLSDPVNSESIFPRFRKVEYPFSSADIDELYPLGDSLLCNVDNQLFLFDQSLLNRTMQHPNLFIEQFAINSKASPINDIAVQRLSTCNVTLTLSALYFNNAANSYQYRVINGSDTTPWFGSTVNKINLLLSQYGTHRIYIRAVSENGNFSATKMVSVQLVPPFYYSWWFILCELAAGMLILLYGVYLYNKRRKRRYEQEIDYMQLEYRSVNSLLNPHFIFNAINNIQGLVSEQQGEKANEYLHLLSRLIRQNIENLQFTLIPLKKELELVTHYVYLQNLRFNNHIHFLVHDHLPHTDIHIPPLLIHTFVENAIVHGYRSDIAFFTIVLELDLSTDDYLIVKVTDNGLGYHHRTTDTSLADKTSLGIDSIRKRLHRLSSFHKLNYSVNITDLASRGGRGTEVLLTLYARLAELV